MWSQVCSCHSPKNEWWTVTSQGRKCHPGPPTWSWREMPPRPGWADLVFSFSSFLHPLQRTHMYWAYPVITIWDTGKDTGKTIREAFVKHLLCASVAPALNHKASGINRWVETKHLGPHWVITLEELISLALETWPWTGYQTSLGLYTG